MAMLRPIVGPRTLGGGSYDGGGTFAPVSPNDPTTMPIQGAGLPSATSGPPLGGGGGFQMPTGIDPALAAIYQQGNLQPGDRGTGFADWQYWQDKGPSQYARLTADIAGTGTDQPTGTPGQGAWMTSGQGGAPAGSAALIHGGSPQVSAGADQILSQVEGNLNSYIRQLLASSSSGGNSGGSDSGNQQQPI